MEIVLASQSPRRRELLEKIGLTPFTVIAAQGEELAPPGLAPEDLVTALSAQKAAEVALLCSPDALVIAADTIVVLDGAVLGKPQSAAHAAELLTALSGREHEVYTGLTLRRGEVCRSTFERARVFFRPLSPGEIDAYVASGEPMDKAGAYGAQGLGSLLVERIEGDFFTVMGLPLCRLGQLLPEFGVTLLHLPPI